LRAAVNDGAAFYPRAAAAAAARVEGAGSSLKSVAASRDAQAVALLSCSTTAGRTVGELRGAGRMRTNSAALVGLLKRAIFLAAK